MPAWEYRTIKFNVSGGKHLHEDEIDRALNALGNDGWECYAVVPVENEAETMCLVYHLRRPAEPKQRMGFRA